MKNLKKLSRQELRSVNGGLQSCDQNCIVGYYKCCVGKKYSCIPEGTACVSNDPGNPSGLK